MPNVSRVLTFKLRADGQLPDVDWTPNVVFNPPPRTASPEAEEAGFALYQDTCTGCHGLNAVSGLLVPDLRGSGLIHDADSWDKVVREGILAKRGMAGFADYLNREQSEAIRAYIIREAHRGKELQEARASSSAAR
jgi:mono/diheme cytochrome c family protein